MIGNLGNLSKPLGHNFQINGKFRYGLKLKDY